MKKVMFIAVAAIMMATANVKGEEKADAVTPVNYEMNVNMRSLTRYLHLNEEQQEVMTYASDNFRYAVSRLKRTREEKRADRMQAALRTNLSYAHKTLNEQQYRQYLVVLNNTLTNKGLNTLLYDNEVAMSK